MRSIKDLNVKKDLVKRLATLQRFWRSYHGIQSSQEAGSRLAYESARAFVKWVCDQEPMPIGTPSSQTESASYGSLVLPLMKDPHQVGR